MEKNWVRAMGTTLSVATELVAFPVVGYWIGNWLHHKWGVSYFFILGFSLLGLIASFVRLTRRLR